MAGAMKNDELEVLAAARGIKAVAGDGSGDSLPAA